MRLRLFGKTLAGSDPAPRPITPDTYAALALKSGQTVYTKTVTFGILKADRKIMEIEAAGWQLHFRNDSVRSGRRVTVLTFRPSGPAPVERG